jgi:hypothetical protein
MFDFCFRRPHTINPGSNVTVREGTGKRIAAAQ